MDKSTSETEVFNELAYEFAERYRRGERPSLTEYTVRHPGLAEEIRELFPALVMMEKLGSGGDPPSKPDGDRRRSSATMPERLGDYRLLRELGRGGMGIVYEAVQESLGRHVALKVLSLNGQTGRVQLIRFRREAKVAALLHHTNIVPVFFVGEDDGVHYYAMQYIRGQGLHLVLRDLIRRRRDVNPSQTRHDGSSGSMSASLATRLLMGATSPPAVRTGSSTGEPSPEDRPGESLVVVTTSPRGEDLVSDRPSSLSTMLGRKETRYYCGVARVGVQVAEALAHAHLHGVLHRDIKPANLLLDLDGTIWVTDFGLAKSEGSEELTSPGDVVGTLRYMAPERFRGKADPRGDVYSLGVTLYEMLTLKPAFSASHRVQLIHTILHEEPTRPRKHDPRIPRDLETIVLKSIAKEPADRFATASEMASELRRFVEGRPIRSRPVSMSERLWRWSRRNPAVALLILLAASLTTILAIGSTVAAWKFREQRDALLVAHTGTNASLDRALKAEREGKAELGRSLSRQARAIRYSGHSGRRFDALQTLSDAAKLAHEDGAAPVHAARLRDEVIAALALADDHPVQTWPVLELRPDKVACSIQGDRYMNVADDFSMRVYRLSDKSLLQVLGVGTKESRAWPRFVPGGRFLCVATGRVGTEMWDLQEGKVPERWPADARGATPSSDGQQIAVLRTDGQVHVYDLPDMTEVACCPVPYSMTSRFPSAWLALSEDGSHLGFIQAGLKFANIYELPSGRLVREIKLPSARVQNNIALSRTGGLLAIAHDRVISIYDTADGEQLSLLQGHQSEGINAKFQPGGSLLASSSWDGTTRLWDPIRGHLLVTLRGYLGNWDGSSSLEIEREPNLIRHQIASGIERRTIDCKLLGDSAGATLYGPARIAYSPDGRLIAMALRPDGVRIVRASDGVGLAQLPIDNCDEVLFMPDGALVTSNVRGLCRWPLQHLAGGTSRLGPPEPLAWIAQRPNTVNSGLASSLDGRLIGILFPNRPGAMLLDPEHPWRRTWIAPRDQLFDLAMSPDGRWAAVAVHREPLNRSLVQVWDVAGGKVVAELPVGRARMVFSPDGRWLGAGSEGRCQFFKVGSWSPGAAIDKGSEGGVYPIAFHPGSQLAAVVDSKAFKVRLVEVETGVVVASLEAPDTSTTVTLAFSPDGRYLATGKSDQRVDQWDLSAIRQKLEALHLASGLPDIFGGGGTSLASPPIDEIEVEGSDEVSIQLLGSRQALREIEFAVRGMLHPGMNDAEELSLRGDRWGRFGLWRLAVADYRASLARGQDSWMTFNNLAWQLASVPGRAAPEEALRLARQAVAKGLDTPEARNTLGVALCRAGRFSEAAAILESNASGNPNAGFDWIFLAICQQRLGRPDLARTVLENARRWGASTKRLAPSELAEFRDLLREAESVVNEVLSDLPADVFAR